jgi:addiction module HigA family antidote
MNKQTKPQHPGEYFDSILKGMTTKTDLARRLGISRDTLYSILAGENRIKPEMASVLGEMHEGTAFWIRKQAAFDLWLAESRHV